MVAEQFHVTSLSLLLPATGQTMTLSSAEVNPPSPAFAAAITEGASIDFAPALRAFFGLALCDDESRTVLGQTLSAHANTRSFHDECGRCPAKKQATETTFPSRSREGGGIVCTEQKTLINGA